MSTQDRKLHDSSEECDQFHECMTQVSSLRQNVQRNATQKLIDEAPPGWAQTICRTTYEFKSQPPLLVKSQRGKGYILIANMYKFKLRGKWNAVSCEAGTTLTCGCNDCGLMCKTKLNSSHL